MSFNPDSFSLHQALSQVAHVEQHKDLAAHLLARYTDSAPHLKAYVLLADHGIADSLYSRKAKTYTFAKTIEASEGILDVFSKASHKPLYYDVAVDRYWPALEGVENEKIARGSKNFLTTNALEPQRLMQAVSLGAGIADAAATNSVLYLCDMGAGNDISSEALVQSTWENAGTFQSVQAAELLDFKLKVNALDAVDPSHPFNYLERFGGYDTAVYFGLLHQARQRGLLAIVDGWSAMAAFALSLKFQADSKEHVLVGSHFNSSIIGNFLEQQKIAPLSTQVNDLEGGKQFAEIEELLSTLWPIATTSA